VSLPAKLAAGLTELGLNLPDATQRRLLDYIALLQKWNKTYNLTAVRESQRMITHHLLDCLAVLPHVRGANVVDVGSGAGLPGIPLALARETLNVTLVESSHKKVAFLRQAITELALQNVQVVSERVESWRPADRFDTVVSRAFSDLPEFMVLAGHLCAPGGTLIAMKGVHPYEEIAQLPAGYRLREVTPLKVPGLDAERHLVLIEPN
jgi:16S rRNA (guanine527-N7)-methyltransferase